MQASQSRRETQGFADQHIERQGVGIRPDRLRRAGHGIARGALWVTELDQRGDGFGFDAARRG